MEQHEKDYTADDRIESYQEYIADKRKLKYARKPIGRFYSIGEYYKHFIRTDKSPNRIFNIDKKLYKQIFNRIMECFLEELYISGMASLPFYIGYFRIHKFEHKPKLVNGKLKYSGPINWKETMKLWYDDKEAEQNKVFVRVPPSTKYTVRFKVNKHSSGKNIKYYTAKMVRSVTNQINQKAAEGEPPVCYNNK